MRKRVITVAKKQKTAIRAKAITKKRVQATEDKPFELPKVGIKPELDEDAWDEEGLTIRQTRFVAFLLGKAGGNATRAAEMAGYAAENRESLKATAARALSLVNVRSAIARRLAVASLNPEWLKRTTAALAASNMGSFLRLEDGKPILDWEQAERMGAFIQVRKYKEKGFKVGETIDVVERSIEMHNPAPYLQLLARIMGMISESPTAAVSVTVNTMSDDDLVRIATASRLRTTA